MMDNQKISSQHDLQHLLPWVHKIAVLPDSDRIQRIRTDRWVGYTRATGAIDKLENLLTHPQRQRMPNLLIIGPTNNGKTMIVEKFRRKYLPEKIDDYLIKDQAVVVVQMPPRSKNCAFLLYVALHLKCSVDISFTCSRS